LHTTVFAMPTDSKSGAMTNAMAALPRELEAQLSRILERFKDCWQRGQRPVLDDFLVEAPPEKRSLLLHHLVRHDLQYRFKLGDAVRLEIYLDRYPELSEDPRVALDLIATEYELRCTSEPGLRVEGYLSRFPRYERELLERLSFPLGLAASAPAAHTPDQKAMQAPDYRKEACNPEMETTDFQPSGIKTEDGGESKTIPVSPEFPMVPGYQILGVLGRGGMGVVYKAEQKSLKRLVALKMVLSGGHAGSDDIARFRAEAAAIARLRHPNIVQVYEIGEHAGLPYFSLEYIDGGSLAGKLAAAPLPAASASRLVETLARAMDEAHKGGVVHRDLKPSNILLQPSPVHAVVARRASAKARRDPDCEVDQMIAKITDFGLAKQLDDDSGRTASGAVMGTPSYMAPEQALGLTQAIGPRTDIYALGAILYETLTGRPPFKGASMLDTMEQVRTRDPVPPSQLQPKVPRDLESVCLQCLQRIPRKRYGTALELAEDLRRFLDGEPVRARPVGRLERTAKLIRRRPVWSALIGVCSVGFLVLAVLSVMLWQTVLQLHAAVNLAKNETKRAEAAREDAETKEQVAETARQVAENNEKVARAAREAAERSERKARSLLYAADLRTASQSWRNGEIQTLRDAVNRQAERARELGSAFEWPYFSALAHAGDRETLPGGHEAEVVCAVYSPDGKTLATADHNGAICLWSANSGTLRARLQGDTRGVEWLGFLDGGKVLAAATQEQLWQWDPVSGKQLKNSVLRGRGLIDSIAERGFVFPLPTEEDRISPVAVSDDGRMLAFKMSRAIKLRDVVHDTERSLLDFPYWGDVSTLALSADAKLVALGRRGGPRIEIYDAATGQNKVTSWLASEPTAMAFGHKGWFLAVGERSGRVTLVPTGTVHLAFAYEGWETYHHLLVGQLHTGPVRSLTFTRDDDSVLSAGDDGMLRLWDVRQKRVRKTFRGHTDRIWAVAAAPDRPIVASAGADGKVKVWDLSRSQGPQALGTALEASGPVAFSSDGRFLAVACRDNTIALLDPQTGEFSIDLQTRRPRARLRGHAGQIQALSFSRTGLLASAGVDLMVRLWDPATGDLKMEQPVEAMPYCLAFNPAGDQLRVGMNWGHLAGWQIPSGKSLPAPWVADHVFALAFSDDGKVLAGGGNSQQIWRWDSASGSILAGPPMKHDGAVHSLSYVHGTFRADSRPAAFSPNGQTLVRAQAGDLRVVDASTGAKRLEIGSAHLGGVLQLAYSPDGKLLASTGMDGTVKIWNTDVSPWKFRRPFGPLPGPVTALAFSPDGKTLITGRTSRRPSEWFFMNIFGAIPEKTTKSLSEPDELQLWDVASGSELLPPPANQHREGVQCMAVSPQGTWFLAGSNGGAIARWDLGSRRQREPMRFVSPAASADWWLEYKADQGIPIDALRFSVYLRHMVRGIAFHPNGRQFATAADEADGFGRVQVWNADGITAPVSVPGKFHDLSAVAFSPTGKILAANDGPNVRLWDVVANKEIVSLSGAHRDPVTCLAFSSDGRTLAVGSSDRRIALCTMANGGKNPERHILQAHTEKITCLAFTRDGKTLASGSWDGTIRLWHTATFQEMGVLEGHAGRVYALAFSPDGKTLASGGEAPNGSGEAFLWRTDR
jgi:WD40 repeat protein/serine/threonine protein kinase